MFLMVTESPSSSVCYYLLAVLPGLFTAHAQPLYRLLLVIQPQLPAFPPCFTASFSVIHSLQANFLLCQPLVSAALLHLLTIRPLQLCRCWPAATARWPAPGQPLLLADKPLASRYFSLTSPGQLLLLADQPLASCYFSRPRASRYFSLTSPWPAATSRWPAPGQPLLLAAPG